MFLHEQPKEILERLLKSLNDEKDNLEKFKTKLVEAQKYDLAQEYNSLIKEIQTLSEKVKHTMENNPNL
jgi:prefoldin subunit 5